MAQVTLKRGDTAPEFTAQLKNIADDQELDESATVRFYMEVDPESNQSGQLLVNQPVSQVGYTNDPPTITYDFQAGETSIVGNHIAEAVVTFADGEVQSFPSDGYWRINIGEPVARDVPPTEFDPPDITVGVVDASEVHAPVLQTVERISGAVTNGKPLTDVEGDNLSIEDGRLNAEPVADSADHTNETYDSNQDGTLDAPYDGPSVRSDEFTQGDNPGETITETTSPTGFTFVAGSDRDLHTSTDVTLSNASGAGATEDITIEYYSGADATGDLVASETQSVTVADGASSTVTTLSEVFKLDGNHYIAVSQSGSALSIDQVDEHTLGAEYRTTQTATGDRQTVDHRGEVVGSIDSATGARSIPKANVGSLSVGQSSALTFPDGVEQTQVPLYHAEDTDATTPLSFDTGQIPAYDEVIVRATVNGREDPGGSASFKKANLTVNNYTSANYKQNYISDSGFGTSAGKTSWVDGMYSGWSGMFEYKIEGDGANFGPTVLGRTSSNTSAESLYNGHIQSNQNPVSSVQFSTPFVATGKTTVVGVSY